MSITQSILKEFFTYSDGKLFWKKLNNSRRTYLIGKEAGCLNKKSNYHMTGFMKRQFYTHRLIFMFHNGYMPLQVDHKDTDKQNNKIENLRDADALTNPLNCEKRSRNASGIKNVFWNKIDKSWVVAINFRKKLIFRKQFKDKELAELVSIEARNKYHAQFANHGGGYVPAVTYPFKEIK